MKILKHQLIITALSITLGSLAKADDSGYQSGLDAYRSGSYSQALGLFRAAQSAGNTSIALKYNIALCHLRLGSYSEAKDIFSTLLQDKDLQWWSTFQLAIAEFKSGNSAAAEKHLLAVARQTDDLQLAEKSYLQHQKLFPNSEVLANSAKIAFWSGSLSTGFGSDDNVIDPNDLTGSEKSDSFQEYLATVSYVWGERDKALWYVNAVGLKTNYSDVDEFGSDMLSFSLGREVRIGQWKWSTGLGYETTSVGGEDYLTYKGIKVSAKRPLGSKKETISFIYTAKDIDAQDTLYQPFAGNSHRLESHYNLPLSGNLTWKIRHQLTVDSRGERITDTAVSTYSALRNSIRTGLKWQWSSWQNSIDLDYRKSSYGDDYQLESSETVKRDDDRLLISFSSSYHWSDSWEWDFEVSHSNNGSNLEQFDYDQTSVMTGVNWSF